MEYIHHAIRSAMALARGGDAAPRAATRSTVSLGWKPVAGASGYVVERKVESSR